MEKVLITGARGFIGAALMDRVRAEGAEAVGLDIQTDKGRGIVAGDVSEPGMWQRAAEGCDVVINAAALVTNTATWEQGWRVNVAGARHVLDAAAEHGAKRFIQLSSIRAFGDYGFPDDVDETHPVRPTGSVYVDTKIASEQVALQAHAAGEIEATVIRPGDVYGPGSRPWVLLPLEMIRKNRFVLPARGEGIFSPTYLDNLVDGIILAARAPEAAGQIFTLSDGTGVTTREFFANHYRWAGKGEPRTLPTVAAMGLAGAGGAALRVAGIRTEMSAESARYLAREGTYSIERARRVLGYDPKVALEEGLARTESWLRDQGLIG